TMMDFVSALRVKDVPKAMTFLDDDVMVFTGADVLNGRKRAEDALKDLLAKNNLELRFGSLGSSSSGDFGYDSGMFEWALKPSGEGAPKEGRGHYLALMRHDPDGRWRLMRLMWTAVSPAP